MRRLLPIILIVLLSSSCGIVRFRGSDRYMAGPAIRDYQPKGIVEELVQPCSVPGPSQRRIIAYLPADYYTSGKRYPVIYLLHGARGYETSWIRFGEVYQTADSLWAKGTAVPCIIIMPNVNQYNDDRDYDGGARFKDSYESIFEVDGIVESAFMQDVVALVDSVYRTVPDKAHRAVAGLSIGAYQAIYLGTNYPDAFDYFGIMSPYTWCTGHPGRTHHRFFSHMRRRMKRQFQNPPKGYYLYAGTWDMARPSTQRLERFMTRRGFPHSYAVYPASHDWPTGWTQEFKDFIQRVFQEP